MFDAHACGSVFNLSVDVFVAGPVYLRTRSGDGAIKCCSKWDDFDCCCCNPFWLCNGNDCGWILPFEVELELSRLNDDTVELLFKRLFILDSNVDGRLWFTCGTLLFVSTMHCCCVLDLSDVRFVGDCTTGHTVFSFGSLPLIWSNPSMVQFERAAFVSILE